MTRQPALPEKMTGRGTSEESRFPDTRLDTEAFLPHPLCLIPSILQVRMSYDSNRFVLTAGLHDGRCGARFSLGR